MIKAKIPAKSYQRYIAYLLEIFPLIFLTFIPFFGSILAIMYILFRDALFNGQSFGKKVLKLRVIKIGHGYHPATTKESVLRNFPIALNFFFPLIPIIGHLIGSFTATVIFAIEAIMISVNKDGRRLGDKMAGTIVISESPDTSAQDQLMQELLRVAQKHHGRLSVTKGVMETGMPYAQVEHTLNGMVDAGYVYIQNNPDNGVIEYVFREVF